MNLQGQTSHNEKAAVALEAARAEVMQRLTSTQTRLEKRGVGAVFLRAARRDTIGDMGIVGPLLISAILHGVVLDAIDLHGLEEHLDNPMLLGASDALSVLHDTRDTKPRKKVDGYPEGRRKGIIKVERAKKGCGIRFNAASGKKPRDVETELANMYELLDLLDILDGKSARLGARAKRCQRAPTPGMMS